MPGIVRITVDGITTDYFFDSIPVDPDVGEAALEFNKVGTKGLRNRHTTFWSAEVTQAVIALAIFVGTGASMPLSAGVYCRCSPANRRQSPASLPASESKPALLARSAARHW